MLNIRCNFTCVNTQYTKKVSEFDYNKTSISGSNSHKYFYIIDIKSKRKKYEFLQT